MREQVKRTRYPGAQPFSDDIVSRKLFYGRERESVALTHQILANRLIVLFARSGLGKTSILNAGVVHKLRTEHYLPLMVRVSDNDPLASVYHGIEQECRRQNCEYIPGERTSLWHFFKYVQFWSKDILLTPVLILDQFEELFTLHSEQPRSLFLDQFSYLARGVRPDGFDLRSAQETDLERVFNDTAPALKIIINLREDFLAQLEEISNRIPGILDQRFRLLPLGRDAAANALDLPPGIRDDLLVTRPFKIDPRASEVILDFLERRVPISATRDTSIIEPFQLQLICQYIEEIAQNAQHKDPKGTVTIDVSEIGGESRLRRILKKFYENQVDTVPYFQRRAVRKLCSEFLINLQGRRLRLEEFEIQRLVGVKPKTLQILVDSRLLRREQTINGDYYELSHDSLIIPITSSRRVWFLMRTVFLQMFAFLLSAIGILMLFGAFANWPSAHFMVFSSFLWASVFAYWGVSNFRRGKEMWRRFRI